MSNWTSLTKSQHRLNPAKLIFVNSAASVLTLIPKQWVLSKLLFYTPNLTTVILCTETSQNPNYIDSNWSRTLLLELLSGSPDPLILLLSNLFTGLKSMNVLSTKFSLSPSNFLILISLPISMTWYLSSLLAVLALHLLSLLLDHPPAVL